MKSGYIRAAALGLFFSCAIVIGVSLAINGMSPVLIIDGFLMGASLIIFSANNLLARQAEIIDSMMAMNRDLIARNRHMIAVNEQMQDALAPDPDMIELPIGRVH